MATTIDVVVCSNVVKFILRKIGEIVRYLPVKKKTKKFGCLSNCHCCTDRAKNLPGSAANNVLSVRQISSKLVHFRRSYSRTREHRFCPIEYFHDSSDPEAVLRFGRITSEW